MSEDMRAGARAYLEIKRAISRGELRLRQRLDIEVLARQFQVSATPVRQALAILSAERLVSGGGGRGYRVAFWGERELRELYHWRAQLARLAAETIADLPPQSLDLGKLAYEEAFMMLMEKLALGAGPEVRRAGAAADERLIAAVRAEPEVFANARAELAGLAQALERGARTLMQARLRRYFQRRADQCGAIRAAAHAKATPDNGD